MNRPDAPRPYRTPTVPSKNSQSALDSSIEVAPRGMRTLTHAIYDIYETHDEMPLGIEKVRALLNNLRQRMGDQPDLVEALVETANLFGTTARHKERVVKLKMFVDELGHDPSDH